MSVRALLVLLAAFALPLTASAQAPGDTRSVRIEASYLAGGASYSVRASDQWLAGGGLGAGVDILRIVSSREPFLGRDDEFSEIAQLSAFASWVPAQWVRIDVGLRASVIIYGDSEFTGTHFVGPYIAPAVGTRRLKVGPRLQAGWVRAGGVDEIAVFFKPLVASFTF